MKKTIDHQPQFYKDKRDKYRWRVTGGNNVIYAASSQGFNNLKAAKKNYKMITEIAHKI